MSSENGSPFIDILIKNNSLALGQTFASSGTQRELPPSNAPVSGKVCVRHVTGKVTHKRLRSYQNGACCGDIERCCSAVSRRFSRTRISTEPAGGIRTRDSISFAR